MQLQCFDLFHFHFNSSIDIFVKTIWISIHFHGVVYMPIYRIIFQCFAINLIMINILGSTMAKVTWHRFVNIWLKKFFLVLPLKHTALDFFKKRQLSNQGRIRYYVWLFSTLKTLLSVLIARFFAVFSIPHQNFFFGWYSFKFFYFTSKIQFLTSRKMDF